MRNDECLCLHNHWHFCQLAAGSIMSFGSLTLAACVDLSAGLTMSRVGDAYLDSSWARLLERLMVALLWRISTQHPAMRIFFYMHRSHVHDWMCWLERGQVVSSFVDTFMCM